MSGHQASEQRAQRAQRSQVFSLPAPKFGAFAKKTIDLLDVLALLRNAAVVPWIVENVQQTGARRSRLLAQVDTGGLRTPFGT